MANIADGKYNALPDAASVYEKNGKLCLECRFTLCDDEGNPYDVAKQSKKYWLTSADGAVNTKILAQIQKWCPQWDGVDPFWFTEGTNFADVGMVEVDLQTRPYTAGDGQTRSWQDIQWVNPIGYSGGKGMVASDDKAAIMAKYGAKFKAAAATSSAKAVPSVTARAPSKAPAKAPAPVARKAAPPARTPAPKPPAPVQDGIPAGIAGQEIVWNKYVDSLPDGTSTADRDDGWFALLDQVAKDKDQQDFTSEDWEAVDALIDGRTDPEDLPF